MCARVDASVAKELSKFGGETVNKCFNCGNCTAVCSISEEDVTFPRKYIRYVQLGLEEQMLDSLEPWMCYYCGDCSDTCPREAEPGELMMASRRWLTSRYDWTGISRLMYKSEAFEMFMLILMAVVILLLFTLPENFGFKLLAKHPEAASTLNLEHFAPMHLVHTGDIILACFLGFMILSNAFRMFLMCTKNRPAPVGVYISEFKEMIVHLLTQKRWRECETDSAKQWIRHFLLVTGYATMFLLVVFFLPWFQVDTAEFHWTSLLGYYGTVVLLAATLWMIIDRIKKDDQIHKHSHLSDWLYPVLLLLTALTGIVMHVCRMMNLAMPTYWSYMIHLMVAAPMLIVEVPFGKWAHLMYRPLAAYLVAVRKRARSMATTKPSVAIG